MNLILPKNEIDTSRLSFKIVNKLTSHFFYNSPFYFVYIIQIFKNTS